MSTGVDIIEPIADTRTARQVARDTRKHEAMARKRLTSRGATIAALIIAIFWTIPTFGLFVTSFRPGADVQSTGWWTIFTNPSFTLDNYEQALNSGGTALTLEAASVGGGNIEIHRINGLSVNFTGKADTMIIHHIDMPGAIAAVTTTLARHRVNIANMQVYRRKLGGDAMMVLELDGAPSQADLDIIRQIPDIRSCTFLKRRDD